MGARKLDLPVDRPLSIAEIAKWRGEKTKTLRRRLFQLHAAVIRQYEKEAEESGKAAAAERWDRDGVVFRVGEQGKGCPWQVHSLLRLRRYRGWEDFCKRLWSPEEAEKIASENRQLKRDLRALQQRVRKTERCLEGALAIAQAECPIPVTPEPRPTPEKQPDPWADEPEEAESGVHAIFRESERDYAGAIARSARG